MSCFTSHISNVTFKNICINTCIINLCLQCGEARRQEVDGLLSTGPTRLVFEYVHVHVHVHVHDLPMPGKLPNTLNEL